MGANNTIQNKFKNFGAQPNENVWEGIESVLDSKRKKRRFFWIWLFGCGVLIVISLSIFNSTNIKQNQSNLSNINVKQHQGYFNQNKSKNTFYNSKQTNREEKQKSYNQTYTKPVLNKYLQTSNLPTKQPILNSKDLTKSSFVMNNRLDNKNSDSLYAMTKINPKLALVSITKPLQLKFNKYSEIKKRNLKLSFQMISLNALFKDVTNQSYYSSTNQNFNADLLTDFYVLSRPVIFRLGIIKPISKRFSFYTGLDLGVLKFTTTYPFSPTSIGTIYSLGVPVGIDYKIITKNRIELSTNVGVNNDFPLLKVNKTSTLKTSNVQVGYYFSSEVNFNFSYDLNEKLKLKSNIGLRNYFHQTQISNNKSLYIQYGLGIVYELH